MIRMTEHEIEQAYEEGNEIRRNDNRKEIIINCLQVVLREVEESKDIELSYEKIDDVDRGRRVLFGWPGSEERHINVTGMSDIEMVLAVVHGVENETEIKIPDCLEAKEKGNNTLEEENRRLREENQKLSKELGTAYAAMDGSDTDLRDITSELDEIRCNISAIAIKLHEGGKNDV